MELTEKWKEVSALFFFCIQCHARIAVKVVSTFSRADVIVGSAFNDI